ncbi:putative DNA-binding domain-containing protein [Phyllobacterium sp. LjRoot231]|uniref:HvfC/BufC N-terminal domain-containing protein n=1 Tax=Phyllobacterium sp. LjRoot231 TaxID=3342289 RepID=UPI003ECF592D
MARLDFSIPDLSGVPSYAAAFALALLDPDHATPFQVSGPNGKLADKRYNVYRNNVTVSLIEALAATFPATRRITGEDFFRAMARSHIRASPPTSPLLFEYGRDFPAFIERYEYARPMPWLADVARIERAWLDAYHAADVPPLSPQDLASIPPERLGGIVLAPHPATRIVFSPYPAVSIFVANRSSGPVGPIEATGPESALVTRPALDVTVRTLPPGGFAFLDWLIKGETFGTAVAAGMAASPEFDLSANIVGMLEAGAFTAIHQGD